VSFAILFAVVGFSFVYVSANPVRLPSIGFNGVALTPAFSEAVGIKETSGILVIAVHPGSAAEKAGLKGGDRLVTVNGERIPVGGDVILSIDGTPTSGPDDIRKILLEKNVGDTVVLAVSRDGRIIDIPVVLE
jgi:S1-C subfamily serine protease